MLIVCTGRRLTAETSEALRCSGVFILTFIVTISSLRWPKRRKPDVQVEAVKNIR